MRKNKHNHLYNRYQTYVKDKDVAVQTFIDRTLAKTQSMFHYEGLPETLPKSDLERILQTGGFGFVTEFENNLYIFTGALSGEPDVYGHATEIIVSNPALNLYKTYDIKADGVLMQNDAHGESLLPIIGKYAVLYTDGLISLNTASVLTRLSVLISASDDKTRESAEAYLDKILNGDFSVIAENAFFKGINLQNAQANTGSHVQPLIELIQYYKAGVLNELGLNANFNMKRERMNTKEVNMNDAVLLPYVDNMLHERQTAVEKINEKYGTEITVDLASSWKIQHELSEIDLNDDTDEPTDTEEPTDTDTNDPDDVVTITAGDDHNDFPLADPDDEEHTSEDQADDEEE